MQLLSQLKFARLRVTVGRRGLQNERLINDQEAKSPSSGHAPADCRVYHNLRFCDYFNRLQLLELARAQLTGCPTQTLDTYGWGRLRTVKYSFIISDDGTLSFSADAKQQMVAAFETWNTENLSNCMGVRFAFEPNAAMVME